jgi:UDP-3-O-[3-hydroxymyristoyl] N-acetylglucosamine deacetylase/3-hydroxyacyl-[acyl-carrier-protein] dehydratase
MLKATRPQRTLADVAEVRGVGFFHGADVTVRFHPADPGTGIVFERRDLPDRPRVPARVENVVPTQRRTTIRKGPATIEMVEHVLAALAGLQIDNCLVQVNAGECPGCDGSSAVFVEALDRAGTIEQNRPQTALVVEEPLSVQEGDAILAVHPGPAGRLAFTYPLTSGRGAFLPPQSFCIEISPDSFRREVAGCRTFLMEPEAAALRAAGVGIRATYADLLIFGRDGVVGNHLRFADECVRHKVLDMMGDLSLLGLDLQAFVVGYRSGHHTNALLVRKLLEREHARNNQCGHLDSVVLGRDGGLDSEAIMDLLPHRYPFLLVDRVIELEPGRRAIAIKNVSVNEPFFQGHWPGRPIMPGVLIIEALAQTAGVLIGSCVQREGRVALIVAIDEVKLRRPVEPGDQLRLEVVGHRIKNNSANISAVAKVGDAVAAEAKLRFVIVSTSRAGRALDNGAAGHSIPAATA